nr:uncharacterized protein LOC127339873 [Lolium perenne]
MSTPINLHRTKTAIHGELQQRAGHLAELEDPKEGGVLRRRLQEGEWRKYASSSPAETKALPPLPPIHRRCHASQPSRSSKLDQVDSTIAKAPSALVRLPHIPSRALHPRACCSTGDATPLAPSTSSSRPAGCLLPSSKQAARPAYRLSAQAPEPQIEVDLVSDVRSPRLSPQELGEMIPVDSTCKVPIFFR